MMKILYVLKFHESPAIGTDEYERIGQEAYSAGLIENELSGIDERLVLVVQKCIVYALLREDRDFGAAIGSALEPTLDEFGEVLEQLLLNGRGGGCYWS